MVSTAGDLLHLLAEQVLHRSGIHSVGSNALDLITSAQLTVTTSAEGVEDALAVDAGGVTATSSNVHDRVVLQLLHHLRSVGIITLGIAGLTNVASAPGVDLVLV